MRKLRNIVILLVITLFITVPGYAVNTAQKVYDNANLLSHNERQQLRVLANEFIAEHNMDIVLLTTTNSGGRTREYAIRFFEENNFGLNTHYDGILFLIDRSRGHNDVYMVTSGEAIRIFDDARIDSIINSVAAVRDRGHYEMFDAFIRGASNYASQGVAPSNRGTYLDEDGNLQYKRMFPWIIILLISLGVSTVTVVVLLLRNKMVRRATQACEYLDRESIQYTKVEDRFVGTHTTTTRINNNTGGSSSGGGRVGGSTTSRGSSGRSFGGGGRRL